VPTKRQRVSRGRSGAIHPAVLEWLTEGYAAVLEHFPESIGFPREVRNEELEKLWRAHGRAILASWVHEHPGTRPAAWWLFDATDDRRVVDARGQVPDDSVYPGPLFGATQQWVPATEDTSDPYAWHTRSWKHGHYRVNDQDPPIVESQAEFLRRRRAFLPGERARLTPVDFEPVRLGPAVPEPYYVALYRKLDEEIAASVARRRAAAAEVAP
jgi:hypothetical protein